MSAIASPRTSLTSLTSATPTTSTPPTPSLSRTASPTRNPQQNPHQSNAPAPRRRNRAALRDYYNLKSAAPVDRSNGVQHEEAEVKESELDIEGFDAEAYVKGVLAGQGLEGVLRVEGGLINEIKALDGERKALVYDNYSKLITATDTIRKMRTNMDPLTPTTSTLSPAISHIAETAKSLAGSLQERLSSSNADSTAERETEDKTKRRMQQDTVSWVLGTPKRLEIMHKDGRRKEAEAEWTEIQQLLKAWRGVAGVQELIDACENIVLKDHSGGNT